MSLAPGITARISVSIGISVAPAQAQDRVGLLRLADEALYHAKGQGRNRVVYVGSRTEESPAAMVPTSVPAGGRRSRRAASRPPGARSDSAAAS